MATTPLTKTPYTLLTEQANIETTQAPSVNHLEKYTVPRFSSVANATAAFNESPPELHQLRWISSKGPNGLEIYDGTEWVEFAAFTLNKEITKIKQVSSGRDSVIHTAIPELEIPVIDGGVYKIEGYYIYGIPGDAQAAFGFNFPGSGSRLSLGGVYKSPLSVDSSSADRVAIINGTGRSSGNLVHQPKGHTDGSSGVPFIFSGTFRAAANGFFTPTFALGDNPPDETEMVVTRDSWISLRRVT